MITKEDCILALRDAKNRLGKSPTKAEYEAMGMSPSSTSIIRTIGSWNEAKEMAGLDTVPEGMGGGPSIQPKPDEVELPEGYEWEELNPQQRWYYKNREHRVAVKSRRKNRLREWFVEYKRTECSCSVCGEDHPACLEFHHTGEKRMGISEMVNFGFSKRKILDEIGSCQVLCANCHRKEHHAASAPME